MRNPDQAEGSGASIARVPGVINLETLAWLMRQWAVLLRAGLPVPRALRILLRQDKRRGRLSGICHALLNDIEAGMGIAESMEAHPGIFDGFAVSVVAAGERAGTVGVAMERLATHLEMRLRQRRRMRAALSYPLVVAVLSLAVLCGMLVWIVPQFEQVYTGLLKGAELPVLTRMLVNGSRVLRDELWVLPVVGLLILSGGMALTRVRKLREGVDRFLLRVPVLGAAMSRVAFSRVARTLAMLLESGVPMLEALRRAGATSGNQWVRGQLAEMEGFLAEGDSLASLFDECPEVPAVLSGMMEVGDEGGCMPEMLHRASDDLEERVQADLDAVTAMVEPVMIVMLALVVGVLVIALFLPMVGVIQGLS